MPVLYQVCLLFEYGICLGYSQYLSPEMKQMVKEHRYLLEYALDKKTRMIRNFHRIFGTEADLCGREILSVFEEILRNGMNADLLFLLLSITGLTVLGTAMRVCCDRKIRTLSGL